MGIIANAFSRAFEQDLTSRGWSDILGTRSAAGVNVSEKRSLGLSAVYACIRVLSEAYATMPVFVYERKGQTKIRAPEHPLYAILHDAPNPEMTACTYKQNQMIQLNLFGNSYAEIEYGDDWRPKALWPLLSDRTWPERNPATGEIEYHTIIKNTKYVKLPSWRVLHVPGFGFDGLVGYSPIRLQMETIGGGLATQEYGNRFFANGARPSGVIMHPDALKEDARNNLRQSVELLYQGLKNAHRIMLLEEGMKYQALSVPPNEAQYIETKKLTDIEIARIYKVPPHMINIMDGATFSNIEHQSIQFATNTMLFYCVAYEQAFAQKMLPSPERKQYIIEHNMDNIVRGDMKTRYESYGIARQNGFMSVNDIHAKENMNPVEGGDIYLQQLNMIPAHLSESFWQSKIDSNNRTVEGGGDNAKKD